MGDNTSKKILTALIIMWSQIAFSQNLLTNGDFEQSKRCPRNMDELILCNFWSVPNLSSPDYFKNCQDTTTYLEPELNIMGEQLPQSGEAYTGIILTDLRYKNWSEYIQGELKEKLKAGEKYKLSLYISWPETSPYFFNKIGYLFSKDHIMPSDKEIRKGGYVKNMLPKSQGVLCFQFEDLKSKQNWVRIESEFVAKGGEQFLILGVFENDISGKERKVTFSKTFLENSTSFLGKSRILKVQDCAYLYIDNVSVSRMVE